jgi:hypothetical protein
VFYETNHAGKAFKMEGEIGRKPFIICCIYLEGFKFEKILETHLTQADKNILIKPV